MGSVEIPSKVLTNTSAQIKMPVVGMGSAPDFTCKKDTKEAIIEAIKQGYRHFDTAAAYGSEQALGEALNEAIQLGLVTREELFVTSKLWPGKFSFPIDVADLLPFDVKGVWESLEEALKLGLTKAIGVSNFSVKKLQKILSVATVLPAVNQMNLAWQQKKLREFCNENGIVLTAFSPLRKGASRGANEVMENDMLKEIADTHGKTLQLDYLDLYLIHWPLSSHPGKFSFPIYVADLLPFDVKGVWESLEEALKLGLTKAIGVSNFSVKKLQKLLSVATVLPAVNQFCNENGILFTAFSPLRKGASRGANEVMENDMLKKIVDAHEKFVAKISMRWLYEQGITFVPKSYDKERMGQNLSIFDWTLTKEDHVKIDQIKQNRLIPGPTKPGLNDLWDDEI
ncbi:hypothetical protein RYX36_005376 [Vicia faba]